ncbi:hypothetical protein [Bradyrhizobium roseum]|uniref:hypothetical protein n=1 Tax=Bradyrhizobium roseum TaxID=3056648 RepID=UPI002613B17F|nr:hypothetical protein [Bradyrhizobium roseus]WKA32253.1 hypothetical protein QUH67_14810 [Bradyrhizobium roseus]
MAALLGLIYASQNGMLNLAAHVFLFIDTTRLRPTLPANNLFSSIAGAGPGDQLRKFWSDSERSRAPVRDAPQSKDAGGYRARRIASEFHIPLAVDNEQGGSLAEMMPAR